MLKVGFCRSAMRLGYPARTWTFGIGFRVAMDVPRKSMEASNETEE